MSESRDVLNKRSLIQTFSEAFAAKKINFTRSFFDFLPRERRTNHDDQVDAITLSMTWPTLTREDMIRGTLANAVMRETTPLWYGHFRADEFSREAEKRGWMRGGHTTGLGRCIHAYNQSYSPEKVYTDELFDLSLIELRSIEFDTTSARWDWGTARAEMLIAFYESKLAREDRA